MLCSWSTAWNSIQEAQQKILLQGGDIQPNGQSSKGDNSHQGKPRLPCEKLYNANLSNFGLEFKFSEAVHLDNSCSRAKHFSL